MPDPTQDGAAKRPRGDGVPPPKGFDHSRPPRVSDEAIRATVKDAVQHDRLWPIAEWMATTANAPKWDSCWVAVEQMAMSAWHVKQGRLISYIAREFMPPGTPARIDELILKADMWMAWRLKDKVGHELARGRLNFWRAKAEHRLPPGRLPKKLAEPDAPEKVLTCYLRLAEEAGLVIGFTRPATAVINALPFHGLKAALARIVDLYSTDRNSRSSVLVTLRAVRAVLRSMPAPRTTPSQPSTGS